MATVSAARPNVNHIFQGLEPLNLKCDQMPRLLALILRLEEDYNYEEVTKIMERSLLAVKAYLNRGREQLKMAINSFKARKRIRTNFPI